MKTLKELDNVKNITLDLLIKDFKRGIVNKNIITSTYFLRQSIIEDIKLIQKEEPFYYSGEWEIKTFEEVKEKKIEYLKLKFNISEEDLK